MYIAILLSTYNGEKYLKEQLDSFLSQTVTDWKVYARDDGSKDNTLSILNDYQAKYPDHFEVASNSGVNMGAGDSFMSLLESSNADYYMFSDQDDVWMNDKIERTLSKLKALENEHGANTPIGVFTDLTVVDERLNVLMPSLWKADNRHPEYVKDFYMQWTNRHASYGCTQMFNHAAKEVALPYKQFEGVQGAHDNWLEYILIAKGIYDYIDEPTILYRQHRSNVVGANFHHDYKDDVSGIIHKPLSLISKLKKDYKRMKLMPFHVSFTKVLWYRIIQSIKAII